MAADIWGTKQMTSIKLTTALLLGSSLGALVAMPVTAHAQTLPTPVALQAEAPAPEAGEVVVTGSRIVREGYQAPTPLTVASAEAIGGTASPNVAQFLTTLPVLAGSIQAQSGQTGVGIGLSGANVLNLRNLGTQRTLVLLDGQRSVASLITGGVDIDSFPQQLIQRVDIVTGGASSVYGSDAVAGVVNFILDHKFSGLKAEISGGETSYGDDRNWKIDISAGLKFAQGRGHLLLSGSHVYDPGVLNGVGDRKWNRTGYQDIINPAYTATNGQPQHLLLNNVGMASATFGGIVVSGPLTGTAFGHGGTPYQLTYGDIVSYPFMRGGDWQANEVQLTNLISLAPREVRNNAFGRLSFDVSDNFNVYAQVSWARAHILGKGSNVFLPTTAGPLIKADNAFLPASIRAQLTPTQTLQIGTLNLDMGSIYADNVRTVQRYVVGANGKFGALGTDWKWDVYYQLGISTNDSLTIGNLNRAKYKQATDAVFAPAGISGITAGSIVCRSTLAAPTDGCVPYNAMGIGVNSPAALAYVQGSSSQTLRQQQQVWSGSITGEPFSTWAGPVSVALSLEHRAESISGVADPIALAAGWLAGNFSNIDGRYQVTEGALETVVPLARNASWAHSLDLSAAVRVTDYSTSGRATTWKVGGVWEPLKGLRFRATHSRDIRAPYLNELYAQGSVSAGNFFDPFTNTSPSIRSTIVGNPLLKPEKADGNTFGVVLQPDFLPGFSASVDYWTVAIKDGIGNATAADVINQCFLGNQTYCNQIQRTNGVITFVTGGSFNQARQDARGIDFEASYRTPLSAIARSLPGSISLHTNITHYLENRTNNGLTPVTISSSLGLLPRNWVTTTTFAYQLNTFRGALTARTSSGGPFNPNGIECNSACPTSTTANPTYNYNRLPGTFYLDASLSYGFTVSGHTQVEAFFNVRNLTNKDPAQVPNSNQFFSPRTNGNIYDVLGRVYRVGLRFKL
ncbi:TonB-dependent receptor [Sphingomonas sp. RT2P30]|uniref:TonB-dependent receptor domain-containing protein n=1 Tax=Parasphingomonas halimpatiens TaxID=3096162 RepID=UPI002FC7D7D7